MISKGHEIHRSSRYSRCNRDTVTALQIGQSIVKWHHMEHTAPKLWDAYISILSHQAMILSINSSFVDPLLQFETQLEIIQSSFKMVFAIPSLEEMKEVGNSTEDDEEDLRNLYHTILHIFETTLLILVSKDLYKLHILKEMIVWMNEDSSYLQEKVLVVISRVLSFASKKVKKYPSVDAPCLGLLAAELSLLCSHTDPSITQQASLGMHHVLSIAQCQNDFIKNEIESHSFLPLPSDTELLHNILQDKTNIAQRVGQALLPSLLTDFVWSLLMKLSAPSFTTAHEAATILNLTLEYHVYKVIMVSKIVDTIYMQLCENSPHQMQSSMLRVITLLTRASPKKVIFQLMDYPVPADNAVILMLQAAGSEPHVAPHVLKTILLILKGKPGEKPGNLMDRRRFSIDATNMMPVAASHALCTLLPVGSYKKVVAQFFPELLMALMFQLFYSSDMRLVTEGRHFYARDALRILLNCSGLQEVEIALKKKNCWDEFSQELFDHHGVYLVAKTLSDYNFPQFPETLHYLHKLSVEGPRWSEDSVITVIFLTELLNSFFKDPFPEEFLVLFRNWVNDSNPAVSKLSLQKIASMAPVVNQIENVCSLLLSILNAFLSKDKTVVSQALLTLRRLLGKLDKVTYSSLCTRIASSYCPLMDHSNGGIRSMAIQHFGELIKDMNHYTWMLNPVVLKGLVPLILFLEDTDIRVVNACKYTLAICVSELKWSPTFLLNDQCYNFEQVVLNFCNNLLISHGNYITDLIADTLGFLGSSQAYLRRASLILIGYLATLGGHLLFKDELQVMFEAIEPLHRDKDPVIRELAQTTYKLFKKVAHKLTSSNIKQSFQKMFSFIYIKKLKPLYNYNGTNNLTYSPAGIKETKNDKKRPIYEIYEDIW
ncbi:maestro heat-like repeat-containing protein family member 9 [Rhinolophus ferrumequinum]|uniref:maestro heat-like repeat-containing protein family member 9 n=1 Tax=Rhinolophus ferrumequinum TaxID=59479 RepID=UPI00140F6A88|nr:maestro heat-like repeat-containing protein family member 9 [Rhinolophus ferrumequinum]